MSTVADAPTLSPGSSSAAIVARSLGKRHRQEAIFRGLGLAAVFVGLAFVAILFASILTKGLPAFFQATISVDVHIDPEVVDVSPRPERQAFATQAAYDQALLAWRSEMALVNWAGLLRDSISVHLTEDMSSGNLNGLFTRNEPIRLREMVVENPGLIGQTIPFSIIASADVDVWVKGNIDRSLPVSQQQLNLAQQNAIAELEAAGVLETSFAHWIFTNADSRTSPASAGLAGAFMGSLYMMLVVILLAVPIGVASAIYLEEFAAKNRITDLIEVNINNLAAVPSIVFGLLGAAVFINAANLPRSAPIVGGLVLTLMTLPTIIIATRGVLKAVPPSIREAAFGLGASRVQVVFHHVLPLVIPGVLTATIIGVAQALGETAPLLLVGMSAFIADIPSGPLDQATALPVQIFLWQGNENRNFFEPRTSAAIIVLLGLMILLNALAIFLRQRFQVRW